jgi:hypothetical protein
LFTRIYTILWKYNYNIYKRSCTEHSRIRIALHLHLTYTCTNYTYTYSCTRFSVRGRLFCESASHASLRVMRVVRVVRVMRGVRGVRVIRVLRVVLKIIKLIKNAIHLTLSLITSYCWFSAVYQWIRHTFLFILLVFWAQNI